MRRTHRIHLHHPHCCGCCRVPFLGAGHAPDTNSDAEQKLPFQFYPEGPRADGYIDLEIFQGDRFELGIAVPEGSRWSYVRQRLAAHLDVQASRIFLFCSTGGMVSDGHQISATPSGVQRRCRYRIGTIGSDYGPQPLPAYRVTPASRARSRSPVTLRLPTEDKGVQTDNYASTLIVNWYDGKCTRKLALREDAFDVPRHQVTPGHSENLIRKQYPTLVPSTTRLGLMLGDTPSFGAALHQGRPLLEHHWMSQGSIYLVPSQPLVYVPTDEPEKYCKALQQGVAATKGVLQRSQVNFYCVENRV